MSAGTLVNARSVSLTVTRNDAVTVLGTSSLSVARGQSLPVNAKSPVVDTELISSGPVPELVIKIVAGALVMPTVGAPNDWVAVLNEIAGLPGGVAFMSPSSQVSFEYTSGYDSSVPPKSTVSSCDES